MKFASDSRAPALARRVFPVPGGPNMRTPLAGRIPTRWKASGCLSGSSTPSRSSPLDLVQATDIIPTHVGHLDHDLPQRRRLDALQGVVEVIAHDAELLQHVSRDLRLLQSDIGQVSAPRLDGGFAAQGRPVRADKAVGDAGSLIQAHLVPQGHAAGVD